MFDQLSDRLGAIFSRLTGRGKISEGDINEALREVRIALLEADVSLSAAKAFVAKVKEKALGQDVLESLTPAQTIVKIVHDELVELLGGAQARLQFSDAPPSIIMLVGLQGSGKTTQAGKLALRLKEQGRRTLLVAADVYRPAAIAQLQTLGKQIDLPVFEQGQGDPVKIARDGVAEARRLGLSTVIIDTAGRLQIDDALMEELERIKAAVNPKEIIFVADAMTGQEATNVAKGFNDRLGITGVLLTKMDGDTRGGAALSIFDVTGAPIKFIGTGEKLSALEPFYPDRLASRILGMGDVLTLIEKTQNLYSEDQAKKLEDTLQRRVRWFAYPFGGPSNFRPEYHALARDIGYQATFSAQSGFIRPHMRDQILPREAMPYFRSLTNLELHLSGCLDWFYNVKRRAGLLSAPF